MKFVVRADPFDTAFSMEEEEFENREDARLCAERYSGKALGPVTVTEYDDAGNEVRTEEFHFEEGWLSDIGRKR